MSLNSTDTFDVGIVPSVVSERMFTGWDSNVLVDNSVFNWTATNVTIPMVQDFIGGRACWDLINTGATATDVINGQVITGCYQPQGGKVVILKGGFRMASNTQEFAFGFAAIDSSWIASDPTDHFMIRKVTGSTNLTARCRKASGTAETWTLTPTLLVDTWYDFEIRLKRDASTAGKGEIAVWLGEGLTPGGQMNLILPWTPIATQLPDTVDLAPGLEWRAGSAANVHGYISHFGWKVEG